ncbi:hypothetical protein L6R52_38510 [Myxococcota bacterium]|nr:hypothetical protein [Myxococcota bacterium]
MAPAIVEGAVDPQGRPHADPVYQALVAELAVAARSALAHVDPARILFVAGAARRESKASIRPLTFGGAPPRDTSGPWRKPRIVVDGRLMAYELCLRPRFFLASSAEERLTVLAHELWHTSPAFDGTLDDARRHDRASPHAIERDVGAIVDAWRVHGAPRSKAAWILAHRGELRLSSWLSRPPTRMPIALRSRHAYTERDLFSSIVEQR